MSNFKERVKELKTVYKLKNKDLSKIFGVDGAQVSRMLNSTTSIRAEYIINLVDYFREVSPEWLLLGEGDMFYPNVDLIDFPLIKQNTESTDLEKIISPPFHHGIVFEIPNNKMGEKFCAGTKLLCREIDNLDGGLTPGDFFIYKRHSTYSFGRLHQTKDGLLYFTIDQFQGVDEIKVSDLEKAYWVHSIIHSPVN